eukprot:9142668-Ditylum_brightwellii.AAC.1
MEDRESDVDVSSGNSNDVEGNDDELSPKKSVMFTDEDEEMPELMKRTWDDDDSSDEEDEDDKDSNPQAIEEAKEANE